MNERVAIGNMDVEQMLRLANEGEEKARVCVQTLSGGKPIEREAAVAALKQQQPLPVDDAWGVTNDGCRATGNAGLVSALKSLCVEATTEAARRGGNEHTFTVLDTTVVRMKDFGGDGDPGLVVAITVCEARSCHSTMTGALIVHALSDGSDPQNVAFVWGRPERIEYNLIEVVVRGKTYGPDDPTCCPSVPTEARYPVT
jgi:hypothetical protein